MNDPTGRLMRWRLRLMEFDYEIVYRPGRVHQVPDVLSRLSHPEPAGSEKDLGEIDDTIPTFRTDVSEFVVGWSHGVSPSLKSTTETRYRNRVLKHLQTARYLRCELESDVTARDGQQPRIS